MKRAAFAKVYPGQDGELVLGVISFEEGQDMATITKTSYVTETKTRQFTDPFGESFEQSYAVQLPVQIPLEVPGIVKRRIEVPLRNALVSTIGGERLSAERAQEALARARKCFVLPANKGGYQSDPFFTAMIKKDVFVLWYDESKARELPRQVKPTTK